MTKILFFIENLSQGGAEKVLRNLVNSMDQSRFEITVHTLVQEDVSGLLAPGIRYRAINRCKTAWGKRLMMLWIRLCAELGWLHPLYIRDGYDIEAAYLECGPTKFLSASTNRGALRLAWVHCDLEQKGLRDNPRLRRQYASYDKIICVSQSVKDTFDRLFGGIGNSVVLYNVIEETDILHKANAFSVPRDGIPALVAVGRLTAQKGFDRLIEACARLKNEGYVFSLDILGEGPDRQMLEQSIQESGLTGAVQLRGFQENPYPYIRSADLVVCPSRYEGFSTVVTEALILGKPVVTTDCSGMRELLGDSEYGLITENSTEGIYLGLKKMLDRPETWKGYAQAALRRGKDFSKETLLRETETFLLEELRKKRM